MGKTISFVKHFCTSTVILCHCSADCHISNRLKESVHFANRLSALLTNPTAVTLDLIASTCCVFARERVCVCVNVVYGNRVLCVCVSAHVKMKEQIHGKKICQMLWAEEEGEVKK